MLTRTWKFTVTAMLLLGAAAAPAAAADRAAALKRELGPGVRVAEHRGTGLVRFVGTSAGHAIARPSGLSASAAPSTAARAFLGRHAAAFGIRDQARDLRATATVRGTAGRSTVRFQQLEDGVPVLGGELVVNLDAGRNVLSASGEALADDVATSPSIGAAAAREAAVSAVARGEGVSAVRLEAELPELAIYDAGLLGGPGPQSPSLVWRLEVKSKSGAPIDVLVLVDAHHGTVALTIDQIEHAKSRSICDAANTSAQLPCTSPVATELDPPGSGDNADVSPAFDFSGDTYDFYAGLGRDSLDDEGLPLKSTVRYCDPAYACPYENAFWDGAQMVYGEGYAAADDVVGHELTHGVTDFSSHLFYYYQSGAINESLSDVFGEFIDQTNGVGTDTAEAKWKLAEDIPGLPNGLRNMKDPTIFGDPDKMTSPNYTADSGEGDAGGVHTNSGVNNKAAFLITDGGSFNGRAVTGVGVAKASRIYYEVQTSMLTSASDYADLGTALPQACTNLIGTAGITAANCAEVAKAVAATEMESQPATVAARAPEAPVCASGLVPTSLFSDDMENPASGNWAAGDGWYNPQNPNPYLGWDPTYATSGTKNLWGDDPNDNAGTSSISMTRSVAIPAGSTAYLRFNHAYGFGDFQSTAYDGGVLEISTNGGPYSDIGPLLTDVGYNGTITDAYDNPFGGRAAFVQESNGYRSSRATLSSLGGKSVRFRFTTAWLSGGGGRGWFIDDVSVYTCAPPQPPDTDGDGVPNSSDACPAVAAATTNGCPAPGGGGGGGGGAPAGGGTPGGGSTVNPPPPAPTLKSAKVRSCKVKGKGRRLRLRCTLTGSGAVKKVSLKVTRNGKLVSRGSGAPTTAGLLSIKPGRKLRKGSYKVAITLIDAAGRKRTLKAKLKVR